MRFTVVDGAGQTSRLFQEEISGLIMPATVTLDMAAVLVNDPVYGLAAAVDTDGSRKAIKIAHGMRGCGMMPNCFGEGDVTSSVGGRDKTRRAHEHYT